VTLEIELRGIELHGYHGVLASEREVGQPFLFDVWLEVAEPAADQISETVDYRAVTGCLREVSAEPRQLLETLAAAAADALLARFPVRRARVRVRKPEVRLDAPLEFAAVTATRTVSR